MCGIAGWVSATPSSAPAARLTQMLGTIAHRGPDGSGTFVAQCRTTEHEIALGHRRLAIIDPKGAHQPMHDAVSGITLVFNGEIYNFRELRRMLECSGHHFTRDSDTEVLLRAYQAWGRDVV